MTVTKTVKYLATLALVGGVVYVLVRRAKAEAAIPHAPAKSGNTGIVPLPAPRHPDVQPDVPSVVSPKACLDPTLYPFRRSNDNQVVRMTVSNAWKINRTPGAQIRYAPDSDTAKRVYQNCQFGLTY